MLRILPMTIGLRFIESIVSFGRQLMGCYLMEMHKTFFGLGIVCRNLSRTEEESYIEYYVSLIEKDTEYLNSTWKHSYSVEGCKIGNTKDAVLYKVFKELTLQRTVVVNETLSSRQGTSTIIETEVIQVDCRIISPNWKGTNR